MSTNIVEKTTSEYVTANNTSDNNNTSVEPLPTNEPNNTTDLNTQYNIDTLMNGPDFSNGKLTIMNYRKLIITYISYALPTVPRGLQ